MNIRRYISVLSYDFFLAVFFVFAASTFLDSLFPGIVTRVFNMKHLVLVGILGFIGMIFFPPQKNSHPRPSYYIGVCAIAFWLGATSYYMIPRDDVWRLLLSFGVAVTVLITGFAVVSGSKSASDLKSEA